jgi:predicted metal-dependent hydrolase
MSASVRPADIEVKPRDIRFGVADGHSRYWMNGDPVATAVMNAMSLTFPDGERMFIDAVKAYRSQLSPKLQEDVRNFIAQEAIHSREHVGLNDLIDPEHYPVDEILAEIRSKIGRTRAGGPMRMLVATIGLEHFTAMMAELRIKSDDQFVNVDPAIERMWRWHAMEEMEHKAVAYDVYMEATRGWSPLKRYLRRCIGMAIITHSFVQSTIERATKLLAADGFSPKAARRAAARYLWIKPGILRRGVGAYLSWYRPGFHPWDHKAPPQVAAWRAEFDAQAGLAAAA